MEQSDGVGSRCKGTQRGRKGRRDGGKEGLLREERWVEGSEGVTEVKESDKGMGGRVQLGRWGSGETTQCVRSTACKHRQQAATHHAHTRTTADCVTEG